MTDVIFGIILTVLLLYVWFYIKRKIFRNVYDPFNYPYIIVTTLLCKKCGTKGMRLFQRGDYIFKIHKKCPKCKKGDFTIVGIYWERQKTIEELKYEKLEEKWR